MGFWSKIFKSDNARNIDKLEKIAKKVEELQDKYRAYSDEDLKNTTQVLKDRLKNGEKSIDILPDAFATVREASDRGSGLGKTVANQDVYSNRVQKFGDIP